MINGSGRLSDIPWFFFAYTKLVRITEPSIDITHKQFAYVSFMHYGMHPELTGIFEARSEVVVSSDTSFYAQILVKA